MQGHFYIFSVIDQCFTFYLSYEKKRIHYTHNYWYIYLNKD